MFGADVGGLPDEREHRERAGHANTMVATADDVGRIVQLRMAMRAKA